jgi:hypothetical protein
MITLRLSWAGEDQVLAEGRLVDLRKRGIVPLAGTIQGPGVVHDMAARLWFDRSSLRIQRLEPVMSAYPFAPSLQTAGEGCPDRLGDVQQLCNLSLAGGYGDAVMERIGGPRGCFHVLTLLRLLGPSVVWAMRRERTRSRPQRGKPAPGSPIFARSIIVDGTKHDGMDIGLHGSLSDVHYPPGAETLPLQEELELGFEAAITLRVELPAMSAHEANGRYRQSGPGVQTVGAWQAIDSLDGLGGLVLRKGFSAQVQQLFGDAEGVQPVTHLVLMLAPVVMQCMPSLMDELGLSPRRAEGPHAATDSCHMWRAGGPLQRM